jgi:hypothetical protein
MHIAMLFYFNTTGTKEIIVFDELILEKYATMSKQELLRTIIQLSTAHSDKIKSLQLSRDNNAEELSNICRHNGILQSKIDSLRSQYDKENARSQAFMDVIKQLTRKDSHD